MSYLLLAGVVLQGDADKALGAVVDELEALDIAFVQQDLSDALLHVGSGNIDGLMLGAVRVADAGEHIRNGICDVHGMFSSSFEVTANRLFRWRGIAANWGIPSDLSPSETKLRGIHTFLCEQRKVSKEKLFVAKHPLCSRLGMSSQKDFT